MVAIVVTFTVNAIIEAGIVPLITPEAGCFSAASELSKYFVYSFSLVFMVS